ncbi:MAG: hypothetical protein VX405_06220, partial [Myxococcota bacterium]|nr:hypothetical protein [Myxococcota bacterium]
MRYRGTAFCMLFISACADTLPPLPTVDDRLPARLNIVGIEPAGGGATLSPDALTVGAVYQLTGAVFSAGNEALAGEPLVLSVETESFEEVVRFPRGATCVTPYDGEAEAPGTCAIIFRLVGPVADIVLRLRAQRALNLNDAVALRPLADRASASIRVVAPGVGSRVWQSGDSDPLSGADPMPISMEDDEPTPLWVVLEDRFGNPLVGERVELRAWQSPDDRSEENPSDDDAGADGGIDGGQGKDVSVSDGSSADVQELAGDIGLVPTLDGGQAEGGGVADGGTARS